MGLFDSLLKQVSSYVPDEYEEYIPQVKEAAQEYLPQAKELGSSALDSVGNFFSSGNQLKTTRGEAPPAQASSPGMWDSVKNYFTDDPTSGWYDQMKLRDAQGGYEQQLQNLRSGQDGYEAQQLQNLRSGQAGYEAQQAGNPLEKIYKSALSGLGSVGGALTSPLMGALAPALGGVAGYAMSADDRKAAQNYYNQSLNSAGTQVSVGPSASENLQDSQQDLANRAMATQQVAQRAQMGLTPEDMAMFQQARQQADESYQANQSKIQTDMNRRGMGMSPAMIAAQQQQAAQDTARRQADDANKVTQASFQAKQQAAQNLGTMSNANLNGDFSRGLAKANNQDAIAQFNAAQQRARATALTGAQQAAGQNSSNQAVNTANAMTGIGTGVGTAIGTLNANKK